jgi:hypothetical protein
MGKGVQQLTPHDQRKHLWGMVPAVDILNVAGANTSLTLYLSRISSFGITIDLDSASRPVLWSAQGGDQRQRLRYCCTKCYASPRRHFVSTGQSFGSDITHLVLSFHYKRIVPATSRENRTTYQ